MKEPRQKLFQLLLNLSLIVLIYVSSYGLMFAGKVFHRTEEEGLMVIHTTNAVAFYAFYPAIVAESFLFRRIGLFELSGGKDIHVVDPAGLIRD